VLEVTAQQGETVTAEPGDRRDGHGHLTRAEWLVLLGLCAGSVVVCFFELGTRSLWLDEIGSILGVDHRSLWSTFTYNGGNMGLYYLVLHVFVSLFGDGQVAVRVPAALAGVALTPVVFALGRRMFGTRVAVIATAGLVVSPALVVWDQQARGYSFGTLLVASSLLALLRALERPTPQRWCVYALIVILSIYSIAYAAIFLVAQVLPILVWPPGRRHVKSIAAVGAVALVAYVPLIVIMLRTGAAGVLSANGPPSVSESSRIFQQLASGSVPDFFAATTVTTVITVIAVVCWVVSAAELISRARASPSGTETVYLGILLSWLLVPVILDAICSLTYRSIYNSSFLLQSVPAGMILVAFVVAKLVPRKLSAPLAVGLGALLVLSLVPTYGVSFEDWGQASHFILTSAQPQDCLTVNKRFVASDLAYYFRLDGGVRTAPQLVLPAMAWGAVLNPSNGVTPSQETFATVASHCRRVWIVLNRVSAGDQYLIGAEIGWFHGHGFDSLKVTHFYSKAFGINVVLLSR
jgi:4-amino-4-deoxy-L-arabinose transferase-like glycosyltransferase